ncbi:hypothetical protein KO465_06280 [Candidatus Micrarchaeota archaeon]|jgi:hypothetical protein|nr:hypothetical protein [Candidatus Micrarchaeota archaeon]
MPTKRPYVRVYTDMLNFTRLKILAHQEKRTLSNMLHVILTDYLNNYEKTIDKLIKCEDSKLPWNR